MIFRDPPLAGVDSPPITRPCDALLPRPGRLLEGWSLLATFLQLDLLVVEVVPLEVVVLVVVPLEVVLVVEVETERAVLEELAVAAAEVEDGSET